jgi:ADP-ribosylglycohydrolase
MTKLTTKDRIEGGLIGLLLADSIGVPYEFHTPESVAAAGEIGLHPPPHFDRAHPGTPAGTWSDDGATALCLLESLLECGRLDLEDLARRLLAWLDRGHLAVDNRVFDVGITTSRALSAFRAGTSAERCGPAHESANGNGSIMRVAPLALWHQGTDAELVEDAMRQSIVTHGHVRSQLCCALYVLWARRLLQERPDPWADACASLRALLVSRPGHLRELEEKVLRFDEPGGSGYVVDCLHSARVCLEQPTYKDVVTAAVRMGNDTDTTACVAGALAGIRHGLGGIPAAWRKGLRGEALNRPLLDRLVARVAAV